MNTITMPESNMAEYAAEIAEDRANVYYIDPDDNDGTDGSEPNSDTDWMDEGGDQEHFDEEAWSRCLGCQEIIPCDRHLCDDCWQIRIEMADAENRARESSGMTEATLQWYERYVWAVMDGDERVHLDKSNTRRLQALRNTLLTRQPERVWLLTASQLVYQDVFHLTGWNMVVLYLGYIIGRRYREGESQ